MVDTKKSSNKNKKNRTKAIFAEKGWSIFQNQRFTFLDSGNTINLQLDEDTMDVRNPDELTQKVTRANKLIWQDHKDTTSTYCTTLNFIFT